MTPSVTTPEDVKVYVGVNAAFSPDGTLLPYEIIWEDGRHYTIDEITDIRSASAKKAEGKCDRYTIIVSERQTHLFFERGCNSTGNNLGRWFVERKAPPPHAFAVDLMIDGHDAWLYSDGTHRRGGKVLTDEYFEAFERFKMGYGE